MIVSVIVISCLIAGVIGVVKYQEYQEYQEYQRYKAQNPVVSPSVELNLPDSDGDGMSDWFEENIAKTNSTVPNDRYAIIFHSCTIQYTIPYFTEVRRKETSNLKTFLIQEEGFKLVSNIKFNHHGRWAWGGAQLLFRL